MQPQSNSAIMFSTDQSIESLQQLFVEVKKYLSLQKQYTQLEIAEKLTVLLSTLILILIVIILSMVALFYLSFTIAYLLTPVLGSLLLSFALITCFIVLLAIVVVRFRKSLIINPMARFIANLFISNPNKNEHPRQ